MYSNITLKQTGRMLQRILFGLAFFFLVSNSVQAQYCTAGATSTAFEKISKVTLGTIVNPSTSTAGYEDFSGLTTSAFTASTVNFTVELSTYAYLTDEVIVWVDFNNDNDFVDVGEQVFDGLNTGGPISGSFSVPAGTAAGNKRIRIRMFDSDAFANPNNTPCGTSTYGQVEDYTLNVVTNTPCTGTPAPGNTLSTAASVCPGFPFTLSLQNNTPGTGVTYQVQSSSTGVAGTFTNVAGATNSTYTVANLPANTYYQFLVTCGGVTTASAPVLVSVTPPSGCYCTSTATNVADEDIFNVTLGTLNNSSNCATTAPGPGSVKNLYSNYTGVAAPTLIQGTAYTLSVSAGTCGTFGFTNSMAVWIDYNQNGAFEVGERVFASPSGAGAHTETISITIPATALLGTTRMRVISDEVGTATTIPVCGTYAYGETEDYNVVIAPCVPVTVTTQTAPQSVACGGTATFTAAFAGSSPNFQYQVQTTPGGAFTNITNNATYSGATTNSLTVNNVTPAMSGYVYRILYSNGCTSPNFTTGAALTVTAIPASFTQTPAAGLCAGGTATQAITVTGGGTGVFTPTTGLFTDAAGTIPYTGGPVTVVYARPTATTVYSYTRTNGTCVSAAANVTVTVNTPLNGFPFVGTALTNICANGGTSLTVGGITGGTALTYQYQISTNGGATYTNITNTAPFSGATTQTLGIASGATLQSGTLIRVVVSSPSCGTVTSQATTLQVNPTPVVTLSTIPGSVTAPTLPVTLSANVASGTGPFTYQYYLNGVAVGTPTTSPTLAIDANSTGSYTVTVTDAKGCTASSGAASPVNVRTTPSNVLFIYPSPNNGTFQVRFYNETASRTSTQPAMVNVFDSKGTRVFTQRYIQNGPYTQMNVNLGAHSSGIYRVEVSDDNGNRIKTGSAMVF